MATSPPQYILTRRTDDALTSRIPLPRSTLIATNRDYDDNDNDNDNEDDEDNEDDDDDDEDDDDGDGNNCDKKRGDAEPSTHSTSKHK